MTEQNEGCSYAGCSEMAIPKPKGEIVGAVVITAFISFFVLLATVNVVFFRIAMLASVLWLLFVGAILALGAKEEGASKLLVKFMGLFAKRHFVESGTSEGGDRAVRFGYRFFGRRFCYLQIAVKRIESVVWNTGQASDLAKRDMNDWQVVVWFDHEDSAKREEWSRKPDQDLYIVGPSGKREDTAALGLELIAFLNRAGATLLRVADENKFVRKEEVG